MSRLARRIRTAYELDTEYAYDIFGLMDIAVKEALRINDIEYDHICEVATDEEIALVTADEYTFAMKRKIIELLQKYLKDFEV